MATPAKAAPPPPPAIPAPASNGAPVAHAQSKVKKPGRLERRNLGKRIIVTGVEGIGKTSLVAFGPNPLMVMCGNETGYETLMLNGRAPEIDTLQASSWTELLASLKDIAENGPRYGVVGIDAMGGAERLCHEYVCDTHFGGVWGEKGFAGYQRGYDTAVTEWLRLLDILDKLKDQGTHVIFLSHCQVRPFKNPMGEDFDQYKSDVHHKTWSASHRWADAALFMTFLTDVKESDSGRKKGIGGTTRMLYTERRDAFDAKNRFGMPEMIQMPDDPAGMWPTLDHYMQPKPAA